MKDIAVTYGAAAEHGGHSGWRPFGFRKMTLALYAWCAIIVVWAITGAVNASHVAQQCSRYGQFAQSCRSGAQVGTGLGVAVILFVGFVGFCFLSIIWFMTKPRDDYR